MVCEGLQAWDGVEVGRLKMQEISVHLCLIPVIVQKKPTQSVKQLSSN